MISFQEKEYITDVIQGFRPDMNDTSNVFKNDSNFVFTLVTNMNIYQFGLSRKKLQKMIDGGKLSNDQKK